MFLKLISTSDPQPLFSLRKDMSFMPVRAVPAYLLTQQQMRYYTEVYQDEEFLKDIKLTKRIYVEQGKNKDPLHYLEQGEGFLSLFLPSDTKDQTGRPFGINWMKMQKEPHGQYIHIAEIENLNRDTIKGIGKASIAQAISYYRALFPHAQENDLAIGIDPEFQAQHLIELYTSYGFTITINGRMYMDWKNAMVFMDKYTARMKNELHSPRR